MNNLEITATMLVEVFLWRSKVKSGSEVISGSYLVQQFIFRSNIKKHPLKISKIHFWKIKKFEDSRKFVLKFFWHNLLAENSAHSNYEKNVEYGASNNGTDTNIGFSEENS